MTSAPLDRDQILKALGDADDATVASIIGMGITAEELGEAQAWIANDEPLVNDGKPMPSSRVSALADLLVKIEEESPAGHDDEP